MSLASYAVQCEALAQELADSLTEEEIDELHHRLQAVPTNDWIRWCARAADQVADFVAATPSRRNRLKRWSDARPELTLAAVQHCLRAHAILEAIDHRGIVPGGPYREMAQKAGLAHLDAQCGPDFDTHWPWPSESPFDDD